VENPLPVLILQHPEEASQAKNTGLLLSRCLTRVQLVVGDQLPPPAPTTGMVLLYPDFTPDASQAAPAPWPAEGAQTLVVLDATWRKSRRMMHLNPWLAALPRLSLTATPPSRYAIRRAHDADQRSTLEACALALTQLDGAHGDRYEPLWAAMDAFVRLQQQLAREGRARREATTSASG
jgi:DTW domain-containing protein YfiP